MGSAATLDVVGADERAPIHANHTEAHSAYRNAKVVEISKTDDMKGRLHLAGAVPVIQTVAEMNTFWENDTRNMVELIKAANIKIE